MFITQLKLAKTPQAAPALTSFLSSRYREHQVLWELAGRSATAQRDFLYRAETAEDGLTLITLSDAPFNAVKAPWEATSKPYSPAFSAGQLLRFSLRASVTVDRAREGQRSQRTDLVMERYRELEGKVPLLTVAQSAAAEWLNSRAETSGFRLVEVTAGNYQRVSVMEKGRPFKIPSLDMEGVIELTNPEQFLERQQKGFGKTRFAGMGLMLVKPL